MIIINSPCSFELTKGPEARRELLMNLYETGLIFDPQLEEAGFDEELKKVTDLIEANSGKIEKIDRWGIRKLAYQIKKKSQGFYAFIYYTSPGQVPKLLEGMLRINEHCLRFMTIVPDVPPDFEEQESRKPGGYGYKRETYDKPKAPARPAEGRETKETKEDF
jgi:small subunit ribosomal protein S6